MAAVSYFRAMHRRWLLGWCWWLIATLCPAQTANPFELGPRPVPPAEAATAGPVNPFELRDTAVGEAAPLPLAPPAPAPPNDGDAERRSVFGYFIGLSLLLTLAVVLLRGELAKAYAAFLNDNLLGGLYRDQAGPAGPPLQLLHLIALCAGAFYLLLLLRALGALPEGRTGYHYLLCAIALLGGMAFKHGLLWLLGCLFPLRQELGRYSFTVLIFTILLGFGLYPFVALLAFGPASFQPVVIYASLAFVLLLYGFRSVRALFHAGSLPTRRAFHFFLYLCSVEIAPILLLWKALS